MPAKGYRKTHCKRGHDLSVVGKASNGWCLECRRRSYEKRGLKAGERLGGSAREVEFRSPLCPRGHDKRIVGVGKHYECLECRRIRSRQTDWKRERRRRLSRKAGLPEGMVAERQTPLPKLRFLRLKAGLTQRQIAERIGCTTGFYQELEAGKHGAGRETLRKVMEALAKPVSSRGRYAQLMAALIEAERRDTPWAGAVAEIMHLEPVRAGGLLRWAQNLGLAERFEGRPKGAPVTVKSTWLITDEGMALLRGRQAA